MFRIVRFQIDMEFNCVRNALFLERTRKFLLRLTFILRRTTDAKWRPFISRHSPFI